MKEVRVKSLEPGLTDAQAQWAKSWCRAAAVHNLLTSDNSFGWVGWLLWYTNQRQRAKETDHCWWHTKPNGPLLPHSKTGHTWLVYTILRHGVLCRVYNTENMAEVVLWLMSQDRCKLLLHNITSHWQRIYWNVQSVVPMRDIVQPDTWHTLTTMCTVVSA